MNIYIWRHNKTYHSHSMIEEPCLNSEFYLDAIAIVVAANLDEALEKLAEHLGVRTEKTVAIGDYDNDIAMLTAAGCGVAVENACPAAREAADYITVSNEEHAIARLIYGIENGEFGNLIAR